MSEVAKVANTNKLIDLVRERSLLYDLSNVDYKNRNKKEEAWLQVAAEMGFGESKIWIAKWKNLRDNYYKFKKYKNESSTGQAYKKYKSWPWASQMRFLDNYNVRRTESYSQPQEAQTVKPDTHNLHCSVDKSQNIDGAHELPENAAGSQKMQKRIKTTSYPKKNKNKFDGADHFFLSYAQTFKTFPPRIQTMVKLEIATLFARYELQVEGETDASAFPFAPQSPNLRTCSSSSNSGSVPSPKYEQDSSSSLAVPSPVSQCPEPSASNQENNVFYVLPDSTPQSTKELSEYYEAKANTFDD